MNLTFTSIAWADYLYWQQNDGAQLKRINRLIEAILRDPFEGIGKPEQLRNVLSGTWSRRITEEHRLVYLVRTDEIVILKARYHYAK
jgi:toxin YoeB